MVYYTRLIGEKEIEMRMCVEASNEEHAIVRVRDTLKGRVCWLRAERLQPKRACISQR